MRRENFKISERIILLFYTSPVSKQISHKKKTQTNKALESIVKRYHKRSTFFKTKDPTFLTFTNFQTYQHLDSRSAREVRNGSTRFHDIQISFLIPAVAMAEMAEHRESDKGAKGPKRLKA